MNYKILTYNMYTKNAAVLNMFMNAQLSLPHGSYTSNFNNRGVGAVLFINVQIEARCVGKQNKTA